MSTRLSPGAHASEVVAAESARPQDDDELPPVHREGDRARARRAAARRHPPASRAGLHRPARTGRSRRDDDQADRRRAVGRVRLRREARPGRRQPGAQLDLPNVERERIRPWSPEQVGGFIEVAHGYRLGALFETVLLTCLRRGEVIGLHWSDVDLAGQALTVRTNRTIAGLVVVENPTKTEDGQRTVPIPARLAESLIAWWSVQELEQADAGVAWKGSG